MKTEEQLREEAKQYIKDIDSLPNIVREMFKGSKQEEVVELLTKNEMIKRFNSLSDEEQELLIGMLDDRFKVLRMSHSVGKLSQEEKEYLFSYMVNSKKK